MARHSADLALLAVGTYHFIRGIEPPFSATKEDRARAQGNDWISRMGLTQLYRPVQLIAIGLAVWAGRNILHNDGYALPSGRDGKLPAGLWRAIFVTGAALLSLGGWGRSRCHRELGKWFTFDLAVQKGQKIVQTGPYAYVRHPAYTFTYIAITGASLTFAVGNPAVNLKWKKIMLALTALRYFADAYLFNRRITDEEGMLKRELGPQYEEYMQRVPYRLIPSVY